MVVGFTQEGTFESAKAKFVNRNHLGPKVEIDQILGDVVAKLQERNRFLKAKISVSFVYTMPLN